MTLLDEINAKCSPALIAAREHGQIAALVSVGRTQTVPVPIADVQAYLQGHGLWWAIKVATTNPAAVALIDVANARYPNLDTTLPIVAQSLSALVASGLMAQADMDAITGMAIKPAPVTVADIIAALEV